MIADLIAGIIKLISGSNPRWVGCKPEERQRIYFANHTSHLDAVVLWATLPIFLRIRTRPVAAQDYWTKSKIRFYLASKVFRAVLIEREKESHSPQRRGIASAAIELRQFWYTSPTQRSGKQR